MICRQNSPDFHFGKSSQKIKVGKEIFRILFECLLINRVMI